MIPRKNAGAVLCDVINALTGVNASHPRQLFIETWMVWLLGSYETGDK
jgi:hypothetical protein